MNQRHIQITTDFIVRSLHAFVNMLRAACKHFFFKQQSIKTSPLSPASKAGRLFHDTTTAAAV